MITGQDYWVEIVMKNTSFRKWSKKEGVRFKLIEEGNNVKNWFPSEVILDRKGQINFIQEKRFFFKLKVLSKSTL